MRLMIYRLTFFFGLIPCLLPAQSAATDMVLNDKVYPAIEARLEQPGGGSRPSDLAGPAAGTGDTGRIHGAYEAGITA